MSLTVRPATDADRPVVAALTAELVVPLAERPWDSFEHTDLLDFPGARTREDISDPDAFLAAVVGFLEG